MFNYFKSKKTLVKQIEELEKLTQKPDEWSYLGYQITRSALETQIDGLNNQLEFYKQTIQDKNQRITELQQMLLELQEDKLKECANEDNA